MVTVLTCNMFTVIITALQCVPLLLKHVFTYCIHTYRFYNSGVNVVDTSINCLSLAC